MSRLAQLQPLVDAGRLHWNPEDAAGAVDDDNKAQPASSFVSTSTQPSLSSSAVNARPREKLGSKNPPEAPSAAEKMGDSSGIRIVPPDGRSGRGVMQGWDER